MVETGLPLLLKAFLRCAKHHAHICILVSRLVKSARSLLERVPLPVLARARNLEFQTLPVENLIEVKARRCGIKSNFLASSLLKIARSRLPSPFAVSVRRVAETGNLVFNSHSLLVLEHHLVVGGLGHDMLSGVPTSS